MTEGGREPLGETCLRRARIACRSVEEQALLPEPCSQRERGYSLERGRNYVEIVPEGRLNERIRRRSGHQYVRRIAAQRWIVGLR